MTAPWWLYVLVNANGRTYVGATLDVNRRITQHNGIRHGGAKATRAGRPWTIGAIYGPYNKRDAHRAEYALKTSKRGAARLRWTPADHELCREYKP